MADEAVPPVVAAADTAENGASAKGTAKGKAKEKGKAKAGGMKMLADKKKPKAKAKAKQAAKATEKGKAKRAAKSKATALENEESEEDADEETEEEHEGHADRKSIQQYTITVPGTYGHWIGLVCDVSRPTKARNTHYQTSSGQGRALPCTGICEYLFDP
jgi:membrane protein involved in colicin uptake